MIGVCDKVRFWLEADIGWFAKTDLNQEASFGSVTVTVVPLPTVLLMSR